MNCNSLQKKKKKIPSLIAPCCLKGFAQIPYSGIESFREFGSDDVGPSRENSAPEVELIVLLHKMPFFLLLTPQSPDHLPSPRLDIPLLPRRLFWPSWKEVTIFELESWNLRG